jgi:hypothetical protein
MLTMSELALVTSLIGIAMALAAYSRAGGKQELLELRQELEREREALRAHLRAGYEESIARLRRSRQRLEAIRRELSAELRRGLDSFLFQIAELDREAQAGLVRVEKDVSARTQLGLQAFDRRVRRLESRVQLLVARNEIVRAERLAEKGSFDPAENLLEDAVFKVREVRSQLADGVADDPTFADVLSSLTSAIRSVREKGEDHKLQIDHVVAVSGSLLATLEAREPH